MTIGIDECDVSRHHIRQVAQTLQAQVEDGDFRTEPGGHLRGIDADDPTAQNHNLGRSNARNSTKENTAPAIELLEILGALLDGHPARHLRQVKIT